MMSLYEHPQKSDRSSCISERSVGAGDFKNTPILSSVEGLNIHQPRKI